MMIFRKFFEINLDIEFFAKKKNLNFAGTKFDTVI